jgi:holo-[acyl-carrier protein] synthase
MIFGIGVDVTSIERIGEVWRRSGARFAARILAEPELRELDAVADVPRWLAKRWAAKESFAKAAGTGMRAPMSWGAIAVAHDGLGRPLIELDTGLRVWLADRGVDRWHLSISDEREVVCAMVVLESQVPCA